MTRMRERRGRRFGRAMAGLGIAGMVAFAAASPAAAQEETGATVAVDTTEFTPEARARAYVRDVTDPGAWLGVAAAGVWDHIRDDPDSWGGDADGLARRMASRGGQHIVSASTRHGVAAALDRSTEYRRCECTDPGGRIANAFLETYTDRDRQGRRAVSIPRIAGAYAGALAPLAWRPDTDVGDAVRDGTLSLAFSIVGSLLTEFFGGAPQPQAEGAPAP